MTKRTKAPEELHNNGGSNGTTPALLDASLSEVENRILEVTDTAPASVKPRESHTMEYLAVRYTSSERLDIAEQLGRAAQTQGDLEDQKKAQDAEHKEALEACKLQIKRLSRKLATGSEMRNVQCVWLLGDPSSSEKTLVRKDTGEIVRVMPMQDCDYQEELPITAPVPTNGSTDTLVLEPPPPDGKSAAAND